jgi:septum site-determining protein MinC
MIKPARNDSKAAFDLKGAAFTILVLSLRSNDMDAVAVQLAERVRQAPEFFHKAPLVLDLRQLPDDAPLLDLSMLISLVRGQGFVPVGITGIAEGLKKQAAALELAVLTARTGGKPLHTDEAGPGQHNAAPYLIVTDPVRSGQSIASEQGDLIVMTAVGSGAEITAQGNIHVYGALRGRAFAGSGGDIEARIFCQRLEAELVSIAGVHLVNEDFPAALRSKPVQIRLQAGRLHIAALA